MLDLERGDPENLEGLVHIYIENIPESNLKYSSLRVEYNPDSSSYFPFIEMLVKRDAPPETKKQIKEFEKIVNQFDIGMGSFENKVDMEIQDGDILYVGKHMRSLVPMILMGKAFEYISEYLKQQNQDTIQEQPDLPEYSTKELNQELFTAVSAFFYTKGHPKERGEVEKQLRALAKQDSNLSKQIESVFEDAKNYPEESSELLKKGFALILACRQQRFEECERIINEMKKLKQK